MRSRKPDFARRIGFAALMAAGLASPALSSAQDTDARIQQLEEQLKVLTQELNALREEVKQSKAQPNPPPPTAAQPPPAAAPQRPAEAGATQEELRATQNQVQETREQVSAMQSRLDTWVPNVRLGDGAYVEDPRGRWSLRATARAQFDYRTYPGEGGVLADTFAVRRARFGLGLTVGRMISGYVEGNFASGVASAGTTAGTNLQQAWLDFAPMDAVRFRVGQFKPLFGLEDSMSTWSNDFQERSVAIGLLQNFLYDRGVAVYGAPIKGVYYGVAVVNGTGTNADEFQRNSTEANADGKDTVLRLVGNAAAWANLPDWVLHFGGSYRFGREANAASSATGSTAGYSAASAQTEAQGITYFTPTAFNTSPGNPNAAPFIDRDIGGVEAAVAFRNLKLQGEWQQASYSGTLRNGVGFDRDISAGYLSAAWLVTGEEFADAYRNSVFGKIRPRNQFGWGPGTGWGALEVGLRYSFWDAGDFKSTNPALTGGLGTTSATVTPTVTQSTNKATAGTFALKWILNPYVALMANFVYTRFDTPVIANGITLDDEKAFIMRAQFDFY